VRGIEAKRLRRLLPWVISLTALIYVFGFATDWERVLEATAGANLPVFVAVTTADKLVFFLIWSMLQAEALRRFVSPVSWRTVLALRGGSELLRTVSNPLADAAFLLGISRMTGGRIDAVVAVALIPFITHLLVLLLQITVTLPLLAGGFEANRIVYLGAGIGWVVVGSVAAALRFAPLLRIPGASRAANWLEKIPLRSLAPFAGWFLFLAAFDVLIQGIASRAFGVPLGWVSLAARIPILYLALSIPSVGNFGVREFTWAGLFADQGPRDTLFAYAFATNAIFLVLNVLIGVVFLGTALSLVSEVRRSRRHGEPIPEPLLHDATDP
jgi:hypothetical protein